MYNRSKILAFAVLICLPLSLLATIPIYNNEEVSKEPARFVISGWSFPDLYGQGIDVIEVFENSTGSWVKVGGNIDYTDDTLFEWNSSVGIKLKVWTWQNFTLTGAVSGNDGKNYHRHNVTVTNTNGTTIFSQQNFTYSNYYDEADPLYYYVYEVVLNFLPVMGEIYTATITYEVFY